MTALALRDDQTQWDNQQLAVLYQIGIGEDVAPEELVSFLHECQRRKLDPFSRQIYLIGRYDRSKGRKAYRSQTSIDGFRLIARRAADKSGIDYSYEDTIWFDDKGERHEVWLLPGPPAAAKVVVIRNGNRFDAVARYGAYVQSGQDGKPQGLWRSMPDVLIAKCAEGLALRKAFPEDLGGLYTEEEMAQADNPQRVTATAEVIRDAPASQPSPEQAWLSLALEAAPNHASLEACGVAWERSVEYVNAGKLTREEVAPLHGALRARSTALKAAEAAAEPASEDDVADAEIVPDNLDPEDPWAAKVEELSSEDEAVEALVEASILLGNGDIDQARFHQIEAAILVPFPDANKAAAAAS